MGRNVLVSKIPGSISGGLFIAGATMAGVILGVFASFAMMRGAIAGQVADVVRTSATPTVVMQPASSTTNMCTSPSGAPTVEAKSETPAPAPGGKGGEFTPGSNNTWVTKLVTGTWNTATISNTGADSENTIRIANTTTNTTTNTNTTTISNTNVQTAESGRVTSGRNTSGGATASGEATNTSDTNMSVTIEN